MPGNAFLPAAHCYSYNHVFIKSSNENMGVGGEVFPFLQRAVFFPTMDKGYFPDEKFQCMSSLNLIKLTVSAAMNETQLFYLLVS